MVFGETDEPAWIKPDLRRESRLVKILSEFR